MVTQGLHLCVKQPEIVHFGELGENGSLISVTAPYLVCHLCEYPTEVDDSVLTLHSSV